MLKLIPYKNEGELKVNINSTQRKNRLLFAVIGLLITVLSICVAIVIFSRPPTLEQIARDGLKAVAEKDANLLMRNLTRAEIEKLKLDNQKVHRYLDVFIGNRLSGFKPTGSPIITPIPDSKQLLAGQEYVHSDGRRVSIELLATVTSEGPRIVGGITSLTLSALVTDLPPDSSVPNGRARHSFWGKALQKALPELNQTGILGLVRQGTSSGSDEYFTFEKFALRSQRLGASAPSLRKN